MKRKILFLTIGCIFTVAALAAIQGYFIYNTYKLKEKEVKDEIHKQILELEDTPAFDSINDNWMGKTRDFTKAYVKQQVTKAAYIKLIEKTEDSLSRAFLKLMKSQKTTDAYKAHYANYITSAVIESNGSYDTLFKGRELLFGDRKEGGDDAVSSYGKWRSKSSDKEKDTEMKTSDGAEYSFEVKTERSYNIDNWEQLVLRRMAALFVFSVLLVAFVVILFYLSLRNLITQKKISDIKTDFVNNITHEFKTPIATMDIALKTFERDDVTDLQRNGAAAIIKRQNTRLQSLFAQVKDASLSAASITADTTVANTYNHIEEIIHDFKTACPDIDITFTAPEAVSLRMAPSHLYSLLVNLLDNAVKYGADTIAVGITDGADHTILSIQDNGPGIPEKEKAAIFDKFYRLQSGNIHATKGLGLGLFYVRQIVQAYHGTVSAENCTPHGALFTISLPRT